MAVRRVRKTSKPKVAARTKKKARSRSAAAAQPDRRKSKIETLRLRAIEPLFTVSDLQRSLAFYTNVFGFVVDERYTGNGGVLQGATLKAGTCRMGLSQDDWAKGRDRQRGVAVSVWCTTVQDVDALAAKVKAAGHSLSKEPQDQPWGGRSFAVDDPDGFHLTIYREAAAAPRSGSRRRK
jgi:lactoylglutathione lyase